MPKNIGNIRDLIKCSLLTLTLCVLCGLILDSKNDLQDVVQTAKYIFHHVRLYAVERSRHPVGSLSKFKALQRSKPFGAVWPGEESTTGDKVVAALGRFFYYLIIIKRGSQRRNS